MTRTSGLTRRSTSGVFPAPLPGPPQHWRPPGHRSTPPTEAVWQRSAALAITATLAAPLMDSAVTSGAERKVAAAFQNATDTPQEPKVTIHGFPVLA